MNLRNTRGNRNNNIMSYPNFNIGFNNTMDIFKLEKIKDEGGRYSDDGEYDKAIIHVNADQK